MVFWFVGDYFWRTTRIWRGGRWTPNKPNRQLPAVASIHLLSMIVTIKDLGSNCPKTEIKGHGWFPARPINYQCRTLKERFREAWMVFTGKADPFVWPEDSLDNV